jgi:hypothetical protein
MRRRALVNPSCRLDRLGGFVFQLGNILAVLHMIGKSGLQPDFDRRGDGFGAASAEVRVGVVYQCAEWFAARHDLAAALLHLTARLGVSDQHRVVERSGSAIAHDQGLCHDASVFFVERG